MSADTHAQTPRRELVTLIALSAVMFTHILDFMIMMPLGAQLMRVFDITPAKFTQLVASYGFAAAAAGFAGGFILDRFDRTRCLLVLYAGFGLATVACGLAPTYTWLLVARILAGAFGGLAGSMVNAMVADIIPIHRRGRAMSWIAASFPTASVLGVPAGLILAGRFGWHAPFFMLAACSAVILAGAWFVLPRIRTAVQGHRPLRQMREIVSHGIHLRAFALGSVLVMGSACVVPFLAPSYIANVGLDESFQLPIAYAVGGIATALNTPLLGWLSDHMDRLKLLAITSSIGIAVVLVITRLGPTSVLIASLMMAAFMISMSSRFSPTMTMITNAVESRYRGGFMSVNAALQQASAAIANIVAGLFITRSPTGRLLGFPTLGYVAAGLFVLTVLLAAELRSVAPHVAAPAGKQPAPPSPAKAAA